MVCRMGSRRSLAMVSDDISAHRHVRPETINSYRAAAVHRNCRLERETSRRAATSRVEAYRCSCSRNLSPRGSFARFRFQGWSKKCGSARYRTCRRAHFLRQDCSAELNNGLRDDQNFLNSVSRFTSESTEKKTIFVTFKRAFAIGFYRSKEIRF